MQRWSDGIAKGAESRDADIEVRVDRIHSMPVPARHLEEHSPY